MEEILSIQKTVEEGNPNRKNKRIFVFALLSIVIVILAVTIILLFNKREDKNDYDYNGTVEEYIVNQLTAKGFQKDEISIDFSNCEYYENTNCYYCVANLIIDSFYTKSIDEMILIYNNLKTNNEFEKDGYEFNITYGYDIKSNGEDYSINISYGGDYIDVRKGVSSILFHYESPIITPYEELTGRQKFMICMYIEDRYEYYDKLEGKYVGDKYTNTIMKEASKKYNITTEQADLIWFELYDLRKIYKYSISNDKLDAPTNIIYENTCLSIKLGENFKLEPIEKDGCKFLGYYTQEIGGEQITDSEGNSLCPWSSPYSIKVYPQYEEDI